MKKATKKRRKSDEKVVIVTATVALDTLICALDLWSLATSGTQEICEICGRYKTGGSII